MTRRATAVASIAAAITLLGVMPGVSSSAAAAPMTESAAEAYADLMAIQTATRTGWVSGYVLDAHGTSEGGWTSRETFDAQHKTLLWQPSSGPDRLNTPTTSYVRLVRDARTRAVLALAGRPAALWRSYAYGQNPEYRVSIGYEFALWAPDPLPPGAPTGAVVESAESSTDADGTRHLVVHWHMWTGQLAVAEPDLLVTADAQGRLVSESSVGTGNGFTIRYDPPAVLVPAAAASIPGSTYAEADAAYTLRARVKRAARAVVADAARRAGAGHRPLRTSDVRSAARHVVAALPASLAPVRWAKAARGAKLLGWNRFTRTRVTYRVEVRGNRATLTRIR